MDTVLVVTGRRGEDAAGRYLRRLGYAILGRNVRLGKDEIDLIAYDPEDGVVVFAEVKARTLLRDGFHPEVALTWRKRRSMARAARRWMARAADSRGYRLDLLCVADGRIVAHYRELAWPA